MSVEEAIDRVSEFISANLATYARKWDVVLIDDGDGWDQRIREIEDERAMAAFDMIEA